jgi:hypothetical protein
MLLLHKNNISLIIIVSKFYLNSKNLKAMKKKKKKNIKKIYVSTIAIFIIRFTVYLQNSQ